MEDFKWTDELVLLAMDYAHHNGYHKFPQRCVDVFDEVKNQAMNSGYHQYPKWITDHVQSKSKSVDSSDGEIVAYQFEGRVYTKDFIGDWVCRFDKWLPIWETILHPEDTTAIHSVKRLSDGEVFSVGDGIKQGAISAIKVNPTNNSVYVIVNERTFSLKFIDKQRKVLFTTEDGKAVYEGDACWNVDPDTSFGWQALRVHIGISGAIQGKYFSTESAAKEYVENNKPLLSFNDIVKCIDIGNVYEARLKQLIQQKLNQK